MGPPEGGRGRAGAGDAFVSNKKRQRHPGGSGCSRSSAPREAGRGRRHRPRVTPCPPQVLPAATMTEGARAADEVRVPLGAPPPGPAAAVGASPESPGVPGREAEQGSEPGVSPPESPAAERGAELGADEEQRVPYPALAATVFFCLGQTTRPRSWCLRLVCNPYPSRPAGGGGRGEGGGPGRWTSLACAPARPCWWDLAWAGCAGVQGRAARSAFFLPRVAGLGGHGAPPDSLPQSRLGTEKVEGKRRGHRGLGGERSREGSNSSRPQECWPGREFPLGCLNVLPEAGSSRGRGGQRSWSQGRKVFSWHRVVPSAWGDPWGL